YIIEALIFSALAVVITYGIVFFCAKFLDQYLMVVFGPASTLSGYFQSNIIEIGLIQFAAVFFLTLFTSLLAMRKYLKV
ncbi:MAG: hypothetical protein KBD46_03430, partial [Candidatus Levybacteria bacterium]|nr:hypothetical protein [Candidatus Levybacteria bacterium]